MAILGDFEVTIIVNNKPVQEYTAPYGQPDTSHAYVCATDVDFAIDYKVRCGSHFVAPVASDYIVFRTRFDGLKYGSAHVPRSRYMKPGTYRVRKRGKRHHENGGWHFRDYHFFTADLSRGRPPLSPPVGEIYVPNVIKVEVWMEDEYARADNPEINSRPVSSSSDITILDLTNPFYSWGKNTTQPPRVRYTGALHPEPLATFIFENCSYEALQSMGLTDMSVMSEGSDGYELNGLTMGETKALLTQQDLIDLSGEVNMVSSPDPSEPKLRTEIDIDEIMGDLTQEDSNVDTKEVRAIEVIDLTDL